MLRIDVQQNSEAVTIKLEGRVTGASIVQLNRACIKFAPTLHSTPFLIDMRNVTQANGFGVKALRDMQSMGTAKLITSSPLTKYVAEDIARHCTSRTFNKGKRTAVRGSKLRARERTI